MHNTVRRSILRISAVLLPVLLAAGPSDTPAPPATRPAAAAERKPSNTIVQDTERFDRIVIASDASGSMIQKMASLKDQINKAIVGLSSDQSFDEIYFQKTGWDQFKDRLVPATHENKREAGTYLEGVITCRETDPLPGIEAAFALHPDVIYLVTDGDFPDNAAVLKKVRELNKEKKVKVYTIAFVTQADTDSDYIEKFKTIAGESGGVYKRVNEGDL